MEQQNQQPIQEKTENKPPIKTNWKFITIVVTFAMAVGVATIWYVNSLRVEPQIPQIVTTLPTPSPTTPEVDTRDWQTYRSEEFGFEVRYPKDVFIPVEGSTSPTQFNGVNAPFSTVSFAYNKIMFDYAKIVANFEIITANVPYEVRWNGKEVATEAVEVWSANIAGIPAAARKGRVKNQSVLLELTTYSFVSEGKYYELRISIYDSDMDKTLHQEIFHQILSTFRFVQEGDAGGTRKVKLFYYNKNYDPKFDCLSEAVLSVEREIPYTKTLIQDTIKLLIEGKRTEKEKADGFTSEFPHPEFKLLGAKLKDGVLTLDFPVVPSFATGGSCRIGLLRAQVEKTAKQFFEVKEVRYTNEEIFQP